MTATIDVRRITATTISPAEADVLPTAIISTAPLIWLILAVRLTRKVQFIHFKAGVYAEKALPAAPL